MKKILYILLCLILPCFFVAPSYAYIRDANLVKTADCIGIGYNLSTIPNNYILNLFGEKKLDDATTIGFLYSHSFGRLDMDAIYEVSVNKLIYGNKEDSFAMSGLFGICSFGGYSHEEEWSSGVQVKDKYEPTGYSLIMPEFGVVLSWDIYDRFVARLNLVFGVQLGAEVAYKMTDNSELSFGYAINNIGLKYMF